MNVLAVSAHPDDETLGCGGTLLAHAERGDTLYWLIATRVHPPGWSEQQAAVKAAEIEAVARAYGMAGHRQLEFPSAGLGLEHLSALIGEISRAVRQWRPEVIYTVHGGDIHTDHALVSQATLSAVKPFMMPELGVRRVLAYETLSSTEAAAPGAGGAFLPQCYADISRFMDAKAEILSLYASELQDGNLPRTVPAVRALGRYRGSCAGLAQAEAFMLLREIV